MKKEAKKIEKVIGQEEKTNKVYPFNIDKVVNYVKDVAKGKKKCNRIFCHEHEFTFVLLHGEHTLTIDPRLPIHAVEIKEVEGEFCHEQVCYGCGNNIYDSKIDRDKIIIDAKVRTNIGIIKVIVKS